MSSHDREISAGATLWGIHKDDVDIRLNGKSARLYASQGQQRSLALGLKLSESRISMRDTGEEPVLLLDDVFSELDATRREYLTERMKRGQVIMTACGDVDLGTSVNVINVEKGNYLPYGK
jgi:DNA replication and repair protein RecF